MSESANLSRAALLDALLGQLRCCSLSEVCKDDFEVRLNLTRTEILRQIYDADAIGQAERAAKNARSIAVVQ